MGLAVVQNIVNRHHGMISVDSVLGQGTVFDIYLPRIPVVLETQEIVKVPVAKGNECILFVDNESSICKLVRENLKHHGYTTVTQTSSREALDMFLKTPDQFDLVITDLSMSQMTGERLAQELLSIRPDIPIILCTGLNQAVADEHVKAIGGRGSLLKPFTESDVANTIRRVLDRAGEEGPLRGIV
jgi:CheY-like chemotaxis protein